MQIRTHSKLKKWPPSWSSWGSQFLEAGEEDCGLEDTKIIGPNRVGREGLCLVVKYQGNQHQGTLMSDDSIFLRQLHEKLQKECLGLSIRQIGNLDIDF